MALQGPLRLFRASALPHRRTAAVPSPCSALRCARRPALTRACALLRPSIEPKAYALPRGPRTRSRALLRTSPALLCGRSAEPTVWTTPGTARAPPLRVVGTRRALAPTAAPRLHPGLPTLRPQIRAPGLLSRLRGSLYAALRAFLHVGEKQGAEATAGSPQGCPGPPQAAPWTQAPAGAGVQTGTRTPERWGGFIAPARRAPPARGPRPRLRGWGRGACS